MYYGSDGWYAFPILLIPAAFIWVCLDGLIDRLQICKKLSQRFSWDIRVLKRWAHRITGAISLIVAAILIFATSIIIGFDLFNWVRI